MSLLLRTWTSWLALILAALSFTSASIVFRYPLRLTTFWSVKPACGCFKASFFADSSSATDEADQTIQKLSVPAGPRKVIYSVWTVCLSPTDAEPSLTVGFG